MQLVPNCFDMVILIFFYIGYYFTFITNMKIQFLIGAMIYIKTTTLYLQVSSADNLCKQFGPRSGPTKHRAWSESKLFDTLVVFLKVFFEKVDFEKDQQTTKTCKISQLAKSSFFTVIFLKQSSTE